MNEPFRALLRHAAIAAGELSAGLEACQTGNVPQWIPHRVEDVPLSLSEASGRFVGQRRRSSDGRRAGAWEKRPRFSRKPALCLGNSTPGMGVPTHGWDERPHSRSGRPTDVATSVATGRGTGRRVTVQNAKSHAVQGLSMRRRGLEPPPGYPGPGPQPGNPGVICVRIVPDRPYRPETRTHRTIWMLPRVAAADARPECQPRGPDPTASSSGVATGLISRFVERVSCGVREACEFEREQASNAVVACDRWVAQALDERACDARSHRRDEVQPV